MTFEPDQSESFDRSSSARAELVKEILEIQELDLDEINSSFQAVQQVLVVNPGSYLYLNRPLAAFSARYPYDTDYGWIGSVDDVKWITESNTIVMNSAPPAHTPAGRPVTVISGEFRAPRHGVYKFDFVGAGRGNEIKLEGPWGVASRMFDHAWKYKILSAVWTGSGTCAFAALSIGLNPSYLKAINVYRLQ